MPIVTGCEKKPASLHEAAASGNIDYVQRYISNDVDVNANDKFGRTPLHLAADKGHKDVVELLLANGADVNEKITYNNHDTKTFRWRALKLALGKRQKAIEFLEYTVFFYGSTPMHFAAYQGHIEVAKFLLAKGADVHAKDSQDRTPLHYAARGGNKNMAQFLIAKGADVNAEEEYLHRTPLFYASKNGHQEVVEVLIAKGANVNVKDKHGLTALHWAALEGHKDAVELLITHGVDINTKAEQGLKLTWYDASTVGGKETNPGGTALHWAAIQGNKDVVELLIARGADLNLKNNRDKTPLTLAKEKKHKDIVKFLRKHGAKE
ncbi:MAG: ankyrin repeat domain-containing protein [Planctomycetota bacterium]|jgi:cytohesin